MRFLQMLPLLLPASLWADGLPPSLDPSDYIDHPPEEARPGRVQF